MALVESGAVGLGNGCCRSAGPWIRARRTNSYRDGLALDAIAVVAATPAAAADVATMAAVAMADEPAATANVATVAIARPVTAAPAVTDNVALEAMMFPSASTSSTTYTPAGTPEKMNSPVP